MAPQNKTFVLITGCTPGGIGHALCLEFHNKGCHVIATARNPNVLSGLSDMGMSTLALDVTDHESINACKAEVAEITGGRLDILVNNAGRSHTIPALDIEIADVRKTYEANVFGPMFMSQAFASLLIPARGLIIMVSSCSSIVPYLFAAVYSSTKGAINTYSRVLRMELQPFNVRVMVSMTGTVKSNFTSGPERSLPANSLYLPAQDMFEERLTFSQKNGTMPTEKYAAGLVNAALKGEGWLGGLIGGSPDWYWAGGFSFGAWFTTWLSPWLAEKAVAIFFKVGKMTELIRMSRAKKD